MDDTLADESGIPVLSNTDDIPVHSTPIKGTKIPLPSTRHVMKIMQEKGKHYSVSEQEISELPNVPEEKNSNKKPLGQDEKLTHYPSKDDQKEHVRSHITHRKNKTSDSLKIKHKTSFDDDTLLAFSQNSQKHRTRNDEKLHEKHSHVHPRSASDSNTRFHRSSHLYNKYDHEDNLRSHVQSKPSRSHVTHSDSSQQNLFGSELLQRKESQPFSHGTFDKATPRAKPEAEADMYKTEHTTSSNSGNPSQKDTNTNAFSNYAFNAKQMDTGSQTQPSRQLDLTPETSSAYVETVDDDGSSRLTVLTTARVNQNTANISPLARTQTVYDSNSDTRAIAARSLSTVKQANYSEVETSLIQKQRQEIQMLVTELKDRDRELGDMMKSHEQQLLVWEQDRQRVYSLEQTCTQYEAELQSKSSQLRNALTTLKTIRSKHAVQSEEAELSKTTIERLLRENDQAKQQLTQYEDKCSVLQQTVQELSNSVGRLQAREEELDTSLKLKEKDMISATNQMKELSERLLQLDSKSKDCQDREKEALKEVDEWKQKYENCTAELQSLTDAVGGKSKQVSQLEEEVLSLRHHLSVLQKDAEMREKCQDELIESIREKQERTDSQLRNFRELYERQIRESSKRHLQVDASKDFFSKKQNIVEQQLSGSYSNRGNSRLSDRSPDRHRNTLFHTSRCRDTDIDSYNSQQHTQSSGYQTQVSGNQSELLEPQSLVAGTHLQFQPSRMIHNQERYGGFQTNEDFAKFDDVNAQSTMLQKKERPYSENQPSVKPEMSPKYVRYKANDGKFSAYTSDANAKRHISDSSGAQSVHRYSPSHNSDNRFSFRLSQNNSFSVLPIQNTVRHFDSPPRKGGFVIEHPAIKTVEQINLDKRKPDPDSEVDNNITGEAEQPGKEEACDQKPYCDPHLFENRLSSFLEEMDDIDDNIWDEKGNVSKIIPEVEASPASKLQKLLRESRMMIQTLERTTNSPTFKQGPKLEEESLKVPTSEEKLKKKRDSEV